MPDRVTNKFRVTLMSQHLDSDATPIKYCEDPRLFEAIVIDIIEYTVYAFVVVVVVFYVCGWNSGRVATARASQGA